MKIGFGTQLWLRDHHFENFHRMLDEMALIGLDGFEIAYPFLLQDYEHRTNELRRLLELHDLEMATYYTGITFYDEEQRLRGMDTVRRKCHFSAELGTQVICIDGGRKRPGISEVELDDQIKLIADSANALGTYAKACGLTLAWHQHWGSIFEVKAPFYRFMELTDPSLVKFCPDMGQLALGDFNVIETIRTFAERIAYVHYKDISFAGRPHGELWPGGPTVPSDNGAYSVDSRGRWIELGRGILDFPAITEILLGVGFDGWIVDDFDYTGYPAVESATACKTYINQALGIWGERDIRHKIAPQGQDI